MFHLLLTMVIIVYQKLHGGHGQDYHVSSSQKQTD